MGGRSPSLLVCAGYVQIFGAEKSKSKSFFGTKQLSVQSAAPSIRISELIPNDIGIWTYSERIITKADGDFANHESDNPTDRKKPPYQMPGTPTKVNDQSHSKQLPDINPSTWRSEFATAIRVVTPACLPQVKGRDKNIEDYENLIKQTQKATLLQNPTLALKAHQWT